MLYYLLIYNTDTDSNLTSYLINFIEITMNVTNGENGYFEVNLQKENFKFNAAHFVTFKGFRERLHGHNYRVGVKLVGLKIRNDGYLIDFGDVKKSCRKCCKVLNEHVLIPMKSDVMDIQVHESTIELRCHVDDCEFSFPKDDCVMLPIVHSTAEELCVFFWNTIGADLGMKFIRDRGITSMEISVAEDLNQAALFRHPIPKETDSEDEAFELKLSDFIATNKSVSPKPCFGDEKENTLSKKAVTELSDILSDMKKLQHSDGCDCCNILKGVIFEKLNVIASSMK